MKDRLRRYRGIIFEIEAEEARQRVLSGVPGFASERAQATIRSRIRELKAAEAAEHRELMAIIEELPTPEQRQVILSRYIDGHTWGGVTQVLFGTRPDFYLRRESYERRVYRIHGNALANANRLSEKTFFMIQRRRFIRGRKKSEKNYFFSKKRFTS